MPSYGDKVQLTTNARNNNIVLADVDRIAGSFKIYTAAELASLHINYVQDEQLVWVSDSGSLYQANVIPADFINTFTDTVEWNSFSFNSGSFTSASISGNTLTLFSQELIGQAGSRLSMSIDLPSANGLTNAATASFFTTASATNNVITFTQGDGSTFEITVATGSGGGGGGVSSYADLTNVPSGILSSSAQFTGLGDVTISGSFLPSANEAFDLGSDTARWRDLHLSGSSIYMGGNLISIVDGALRVFEGLSPTGSALASNLSGSFTGSFLGDGSGLTNVSAAPFFAATGSRYVTIEDIEISGSLMLDFSEAVPPLEIASGGITYFGLNGEGVTYFATRSSAPEVHKGGLYLDDNYNLYLGTD